MSCFKLFRLTPSYETSDRPSFFGSNKGTAIDGDLESNLGTLERAVEDLQQMAYVQSVLPGSQSRALELQALKHDA